MSSLRNAIPRKAHKERAQPQAEREIEAMEIGEEGSASKNMKLALEDYLDFIKNRHHQLNADQLRKVISMHGFRGNNNQKSMLVEAVKTINVMDLRRSTLNEVSSHGWLSLKGVIKDLNDLQWQECHVTSLISIPVNQKKLKGIRKKAVDAAGSTSVSEGKKAVEVVAADDPFIIISSYSSSTTSTISVNNRKKESSIEKKAAVEEDTHDSTSTSTSVSLKKRKRLGMKPV